MSPSLVIDEVLWPVKQLVLVGVPLPKVKFHKAGAVPCVPVKLDILMQFVKSTLWLLNRVPSSPAAQNISDRRVSLLQPWKVPLNDVQAVLYRNRSAGIVVNPVQL